MHRKEAKNFNWKKGRKKERKQQKNIKSNTSIY